MKSIVERIRALGPDFATEADALEAFLQSRSETRFTIANAGTTNTGKSSLFNALLGRDGAFKTADIRETVVCRDLGWGPKMVLTDTPGCDSTTEADDREATKAYQRADLVLFVHNLSTGDLKQGELAVLESVRRAMGKHDFKTRTIIVGTRLDGCTAQMAKVNREACEEQLMTNLGVKLPWADVSAKRHLRALALARDGQTEKAAVLRNASGVEPLAQLIRQTETRLGKRGLERFDGLKAKLRSRLSRLERERDAAESEVARAEAQMRADMEPYQEMLRALKVA